MSDSSAISQTHTWTPCRHGLHGGIAVAGCARRIAFVLENAGDQVANVGFVIDDKNFRTHSYSPATTTLAVSVLVGTAVSVATGSARNRILIQARVLIDAGELRMPGNFGFDKAAWARAQEAYAPHFGGDKEKSSYQLFTQNQWYAGKLVSSGKLPPLRRLIDNQQEFIAAFEEIIRRPNDQETVLREMAVRCLT